jgi:EmrB/QacA subfamily drug resistance transporter
LANCYLLIANCFSSSTTTPPTGKLDSGDALLFNNQMSTVEAAHYQPDLHHLTKRQLWGTLTGLLLTLLLAAVDQTVVGTAMPRIIAQLNGFDRYPWVTTAYLLTSTIAVPVFAKLSDMYGRKWLFLTGTILFVLASALCGASGEIPHFPGDGMTQLIVFRGLQGIAAGMIIGLLFTIIGDIFAPAERAKYQSLFAAVWGLASIIGPTVGGWITDQFSWRWTFYVNLPLGALAAAAIWFELPHFRPRGVRRVIDWWGLITLNATLIPLLLALTWATDYGWTSPRVTGLLAFAFVMLFLFLICEKRAAEPFIPLQLFREPVIAVSSIAVFVLGMGMFGVILYVPLFIQGVLGVSATRSGSLLTPLLMGAVVGSVAVGQIISRTGRYRSLAILGAALAMAGMFLMATMDRNTTNSQVVWYMVIAGLGMGIMQPIYTLVVQNVAPAAQRGAATASTQFFRSIGSTVGVAVFGSILLSIYHRDFQRGIPPGTPGIALTPFKNPLLVVQLRSRLEAAFGKYPGGLDLLHRLLDNVRNSLVHGLHSIFLMGALLMAAGLLVNLFLRDVPLRQRPTVPAPGDEVPPEAAFEQAAVE